MRNYIVEVVGGTRSHAGVTLGASPRAGLALYKAAQAWAAIHSRDFVTPDDVKAVAPWVLPHRLILSSSSRLKGNSADQVISEVLSTVKVPIEQ